MRLYHLSLIFLLGCLSAVADSISPLTARQTAARLLLKPRSGGPRPARHTLRATADALQLRYRSPACYLFTDAQGRFAAVAADDRLPEVLAYSTAELMDFQEEETKKAFGQAPLPEGLRNLLAGYGRALRLAGERKVPTAGGAAGPAIPPLTTPVRHQEAPYNNYCPYYRHSDGTTSPGRCVVGCVATALETVLSYHRRVYTLCDTLHGWTTRHYDIPDIMPGERVDTRLILHNYDEAPYTPGQADAVARLSYLLGVAVRMNWTPGSSGANMRNAAEPLRRAFGLGYVHYADSYKYRPADWLAMLRGELSAGRPVAYSGSVMTMGGHAFVLDGIDEEGLFHVNWGEGGRYDGYFRLDLLNPAEPPADMTEQGTLEGFFCNQEALLLHPDAQPYVQLPDTLVRTGRELVVDSLRLDLAPEAGKATPLRLFVRNAAQTELTTPLLLFTNAPADTALFAQADGIALTGATLGPGERRELRVYATFSEAGERLLRITPDDREVIYEEAVTVMPGGETDLRFEEPAVHFPLPDVAEIRQDIVNQSAEGRAGQRVVYQLYPGAPDEEGSDTRHVAYCFLPAGQAGTDTIRFRGLTPGADYTLYVRSPWTLRRTLRFTLPAGTGTGTAVAGNPAPPAAPRHDLSGRPLAPSVRPARGTIVVECGRKYVAP